MNILKLNEKEKIIEVAAKIGLKVLKTIKTIINYKLDILLDITDNIFDSIIYKRINNEEDAYDDIFIFTEGIGDWI